MLTLRQTGDRHRALPLTIELVEARSEQLERLQQVTDIHRTATVIEGSKTREAPARSGRTDQARDHGRRREEGEVPMALEGFEHRLWIESVMDHLVPAGQQMRQPVQARAMRQRGGMQLQVARLHPLDVGVVGVAHEEEIAMGQHRALRPAGGTAGIEDPGKIGRRDLGALHGSREGQRLAGRAAHQVELRRWTHRRQLVDQSVEQRLTGEHRLRAAVADDVRDLLAVQLGVDRHDTGVRRVQSRLPDVGIPRPFVLADRPVGNPLDDPHRRHHRAAREEATPGRRKARQCFEGSGHFENPGPFQRSWHTKETRHRACLERPAELSGQECPSRNGRLIR